MLWYNEGFSRKVCSDQFSSFIFACLFYDCRVEGQAFFVISGNCYIENSDFDDERLIMPLLRPNSLKNVRNSLSILDKVKPLQSSAFVYIKHFFATRVKGKDIPMTGAF